MLQDLNAVSIEGTGFVWINTCTRVGLGLMPVWGQFRTVRFGFGFGSTMDWTCSEPNLFLSLTIFRYEQVDDAAFMGGCGRGCRQMGRWVSMSVCACVHLDCIIIEVIA